MDDQGVAPDTGAEQGATGDAGAAAAPAFDPTVVTQGFEELRGSLDELRGQVAQVAQPREQEQTANNEDDLDLSWFDPTAPEFDAETAQRQMAETMQEQFARAVQQASAPAMQALARIAENERRQEAAALGREFPELTQQETAQNVVKGAGDLAEQISAHLGLDMLGLPPEIAQEITRRLGESPALWRATYLAAKASEAATAEDADAPSAAHLEGGSGPGPAPSSEDLAQSIVASGGAKVLPF